ncbi:lycopene cyclase domain-containing protein [Microbacterium excoecariae]|uniref:lycopene cyclase domain-containing protein n=1 Tax=Microbacterium excoecariae TaxID=2715210 RepID=UPI00140B3F8F|nr:lycopene cyclase domain-containing protein [Microbacterium excoecariae]
MTYLVLCLPFLAVALVASLATRRGGVRIAAIALAAIALVALTAVFDSLMIAAGLVAYDDAHLVGVRIGRAPIEDFAYPIAACLLLPAAWTLLRGRRDP